MLVVLGLQGMCPWGGQEGQKERAKKARKVKCCTLRRKRMLGSHPITPATFFSFVRPLARKACAAGCCGRETGVFEGRGRGGDVKRHVLYLRWGATAAWEGRKEVGKSSVGETATSSREKRGASRGAHGLAQHRAGLAQGACTWASRDWTGAHDCLGRGGLAGGREPLVAGHGGPRSVTAGRVAWGNVCSLFLE